MLFSVLFLGWPQQSQILCRLLRCISFPAFLFLICTLNCTLTSILIRIYFITDCNPFPFVFFQLHNCHLYHFYFSHRSFNISSFFGSITIVFYTAFTFFTRNITLWIVQHFLCSQTLTGRPTSINSKRQECCSLAFYLPVALGETQADAKQTLPRPMGHTHWPLNRLFRSFDENLTPTAQQSTWTTSKLRSKQHLLKFCWFANGAGHFNFWRNADFAQSLQKWSLHSITLMWQF